MGRGKRGHVRAISQADGIVIRFQRPLDTPTSAAQMATGEDKAEGDLLVVHGGRHALDADFLMTQDG